MMTVEKFTDVLHQQPLRPFNIKMVDVRTFGVDLPDFISRSKTGRMVIVHGDNDTWSSLDCY